MCCVERHRDRSVRAGVGSRTGRSRRCRAGRFGGRGDRGGLLVAEKLDCCRNRARDDVVRPTDVGTFAGFGADVRVGLAPQDGDGVAVPVELPLCALLTAWVRGQARPEARAQVHVYASDHGSDAAVARGRQLRADIDREPDPIGVLVVADGLNTLTPRAPGGHDPDGAGMQRALDDALASGDLAVLTRLPAQVLGRVAFQVLAGLAEPGPRSAKEFYRGAPHGVGYFAGVWQP